MVQGFYFSTLHTAPYKRLQRVLCHPCSYTANAVKQRTELYNGVSCDCLHPSSNDTRPIQSTITQLAPRWSVPQRPDALHQYQIPAPRRTLYRPDRRPIIIRHIRWCSRLQTMPARRGQLLPSADRWQVMTRCQQYRPGAPAEGSTSPPVQG